MAECITPQGAKVSAPFPGRADLSKIDDYYVKLHSAAPDSNRTQPYVLSTF